MENNNQKKNIPKLFKEARCQRPTKIQNIKKQ